jgi:KipI family sensor histidine kinase inhibitor
VIQPFGEGALLVTLGDEIDPILNARVHRLAATVPRQAPWGVPVPGYASLLVPFDPARITEARAAAALSDLVAEAMAAEVAADEDGPLVEIPVHYGGSDGQDLPEVAERLARSEREVIELHAGTTYRVYLLGFAPGFAYLGRLPAELALPRRPEPRTRVPAGSVAIAERQTAVYPAESPGGWHLIGRTDVPLWNPAAEPPAVLGAGMRVRFVPV